MFTTLDYAYVNCLDDSDKGNSKRDSAGLPLSEHFPSRVTRSVTKQTQSVLSTHSRKKGMFGYTNSVQDPIGIEYNNINTHCLYWARKICSMPMIV